MVFRDRRLSDAIGFVYKHWDPARAAADFLERVRSAGAAAMGEGSGPALVTVILDGENCWESYAEDGRPFLHALYGALASDPGIEAVTVSEALERVPPAMTLEHVPVGSWIRDDLAIWIGHPEKNSAWAELRRAREALVARGPEAPPEAWDSLYAAEASDWFWWYGDDHASDQKDILDALFRAHVARVYELVGALAPASLGASLRRSPSVKAEAGGDAMHRTSTSIAEVRYGFDGEALCVRVGWSPGADLARAEIRFEAEGRASVATIALDGPEQGIPGWSEAGKPETGERGDRGTYVRGDLLEARIPLGRWEAKAGDALAWRLVFLRGGSVEEAAPGREWFRTQISPEHSELLHWSAT
jgi:hypothetical protein